MLVRSDIFSDALFDEMLEHGYITKRFSEDGTLAIANYSPAAQYESNWNEVTTQCRGLIYNLATGEIVARPFPKFFNLDEGSVSDIPSGPVLRMSKMDGSLGILYTQVTNTGVGERTSIEKIATRGSFSSEQAIWATKKYHDMAYGGSADEFFACVDKTYIFEIIFPGNKIVVDYGQSERLVLLDVIDNATGLMDTNEFDDCDWPDKVHRELLPGFDSGQVVDIPEGEEGFVYTWPVRNLRIKIKSAQYVEIHRLVFGLTEKKIWEYMVAGADLEELKAMLPEEFQTFISKTEDEIVISALKTAIAANLEFRLISDSNPKNRKEFAMKAKDSPYAKYLFLLFDGRDIWQQALLAAKPEQVDNDRELY